MKKRFPIDKFNKISADNPYWSTYTCFAETITKEELNKPLIMRYFNMLVDKEDYAKNEKEYVMRFLSSL